MAKKQQDNGQEELTDRQQPENEQEPSVNEEENESEEGQEKETKNETPDLQEQLNELNDKYLRLYSEFENFRRRTAREKLEMLNTAGEDIISTLLPVLDDLERAINSNKESDNIAAIKEGMVLINKKFKSQLTQAGLKEIEALGAVFDLDLHEAITKIPAPSKKKKGKVVDVIEKGYYLNDKVIRYAKVVIGE